MFKFPLCGVIFFVFENFVSVKRKRPQDIVAFYKECVIISPEMNNMQNRILRVKCSVDGELPPKRKVRLTV